MSEHHHHQGGPVARPRRPGTADPGSDPAWEWGWCWVCGHKQDQRIITNGCGPWCNTN